MKKDCECNEIGKNGVNLARQELHKFWKCI